MFINIKFLKQKIKINKLKIKPQSDTTAPTKT